MTPAKFKYSDLRRGDMIEHISPDRSGRHRSYDFGPAQLLVLSIRPNGRAGLEIAWLSPISCQVVQQLDMDPLISPQDWFIVARLEDAS